MQDNQQVLTIVFVLVIGLIGGYMLAEHTGKEDHPNEPIPEEIQGHLEDRHGHEDGEEVLPQ